MGTGIFLDSSVCWKGVLTVEAMRKGVGEEGGSEADRTFSSLSPPCLL